MRKWPKVRYMINLIGGLLLIGVIGFYVVSFATADSRVRKLCGEMHAGMSITALNQYAKDAGLGPAARSAGTSFLVEQKTFGRYGCKIEAIDGVVRTVGFDASN